MTAGKNHIVQVMRYAYDPDDAVGGAMPTGTVIYDNIRVRITPVEPSMVLLEQGVETLKLFRSVVGYEAKGVLENDEMIVINPPESWYLGQHFRIISVQHPSLRANDPRSQMVVTMRRWEKAHGRQP